MALPAFVAIVVTALGSGGFRDILSRDLLSDAVVPSTMDGIRRLSLCFAARCSVYRLDP